MERGERFVPQLAGVAHERTVGHGVVEHDPDPIPMDDEVEFEVGKGRVDEVVPA